MFSWGGSSSFIPRIGSSKKVVSLSKSKNTATTVVEEKDSCIVDSLNVTSKEERDLVHQEQPEVNKTPFFFLTTILK
jgi:hypothetical protein